MKLRESVSALSVALVDAEGETVDYEGLIDPFETRVAAAEWGLTLKMLKSTPGQTWANTAELNFRGRAKSFVVVPLIQGYALVLQLPRRCLRVSHRALAEAVRAISAEAGLDVPEIWREFRERWTLVQIDSENRLRRPRAIWRAGRWRPLEILGRVARDQLQRSETGYRVRLEDGAEITLVREPLGRWYADDPISLGAT
jgi:hypothetical protein